MPKGKILFTGATGFLGSSYLIHLLEAGYTAHIVNRNEIEETTLKEAPAIIAIDKASACRYFIVPDFAVPGSLNEAAAGTDFIIHCGSPIPFGYQDDDFTTPTVESTLAVLEAARHAGTVKRVVIMSSLGAFVSPELLAGVEPSEKIVIGKEPMEYSSPPYPHPLSAYCAAKAAALRRSLEWMEEAVETGIGFDLINLAPGFVYGRHPLAKRIADLQASTNSIILSVVGGAPAAPEGQQPGKLLSVGVFRDDLVDVMRKSLDMKMIVTPVSGPSRNVATFAMGVHFPLNDLFPIVGRKWPEQVKKGILADQGNWPSIENVGYATEPFDKAFGLKLRGVECMLDSVVPQYLELLEKEEKE